MPQIKLEHVKKKQIIMSTAEILTLTSYLGMLVGDLVHADDPLGIFYGLIVSILKLLLNRIFKLE